MPRILSHSVIIRESVMIEFMELSRKRYMREAMGFLIGWPVDTRDITEVDWWHKPPQRGTEDWFRWTASDYAQAQALASEKKQMVVGVIHSHCYKQITYTCSQNSTEDAVQQAQHNYLLSAVLALDKEICWLDVWRLGFTAGLNVYIKSNGRIMSWQRWINLQLK